VERSKFKVPELEIVRRFLAQVNGDPIGFAQFLASSAE